MGEATTAAGREERRASWRGADLVWMVLASWGIFAAGGILLGLPLVALLVTVDLGAYRIPLAVAAAAGAMALEAFALLAAVDLLGLRRLRLEWAALGLRAAPLRWALAGVGLGLVCLAATEVAAAGLGGVELPVGAPQAAVQEAGEGAAEAPLLGLPLEGSILPTDAPATARLLTWLGLVGVFLAGSVAVPFAEEVFFRGVLYAWLRDRLGTWAGGILSAVIFGLAHLIPANIVAGLFAGLAAALAYERSRSLWPAVIIHGVVNGVQLGAVLVLLATGAL